MFLQLENLQETKSTTPQDTEYIQLEQISERKNPPGETDNEKTVSVPLKETDIKVTMEHSEDSDVMSKPKESSNLVARGCQRAVTCPTPGVVETSESKSEHRKLGETEIKEHTTQIKETSNREQEVYTIIDAKDTNFDKQLSGIAVLATKYTGATPTKCEHSYERTSAEEKKDNKLKNQENDERLSISSNENVQNISSIRHGEDNSIQAVDKTQIPQDETLTKLIQEEKSHAVDNIKTGSPKSRKHHKHDSHINHLSNEETGDISPKHKHEMSKKSHWTLDVEDRSPDRPPSSDVQSHPITHPTDQRYPGMVRKPKLQVNSTYIMDLYTKPTRFSQLVP